MLVKSSLVHLPIVVAGLAFLVGSPTLSARAPIVLTPQTSDYWPNADYDPTIPSVRSVLGFEVGAEMARADQVNRYFEALAAAAPQRMRTFEYGESWEGRKLVYGVISSEKNMARLDEIKRAMVKLADPRRLGQGEGAAIIRSMPAVVWLSHSVHGNEPGTTDAALLTAYHLLASRGDSRVAKMLDETVVVLLPLQNPDGRERFINSNRAARGLEPDPSPLSAERDEPWPGGRMNHYVFDMNRDWFTQTQPEMRAHAGLMLEWMPVVVADIHEMGANQTFFFPPEADPLNPHLTSTQLRNVELIARNNAAWFDKVGLRYFNREIFDGFFPGYGSGWPNYQGASAMVYEQGSSRGLVARRADGSLLPFSDSVKSQFLASLSAVEVVADNRLRFLTDFANFRASAITEGQREPTKAYVIPEAPDADMAARLAVTLARNGIEVRRTVRVANVSLTGRLEEPTSGEIQVVARATSASGIASVEATINGASLGRLTAPNCSTCAAPSESYRWILDKSRYPSGSYAIRITAIDREGISKSVDLTLEIRNPPTLTLDTPGDYDIVHSKLSVRGRVGSDRAGPIRTVITLGSVTVLDTTSTNFETAFDLSGVPGGGYTLTARSTDSAGVQRSISRVVVVTESADRLYAPVLSLGDGVTLLHSDGSHILYRNASGVYLLQSLSGGSPVTLSGAESLDSPTDWQIAGGRVYAQGRAGDCTTVCIYEWDSAGSRRNLSNPNPFGTISGTRCSDIDPTVRGNIVIWANWLCGKGAYTLFDRSSGSYSKIDPPAGANYIGNNLFDVTTSGGSVVAYIWAQMGGEGMSSTFDVFRYTSGTSTRLSTPGARNVYPRTNGSRVVWEQSSVGGNTDGSVSLSSSTGSGATTAASKVTQWALTPQVLAWKEITSATPIEFGNFRYEYALRAETNGNIATLSTKTSAGLYAATRSVVLFGEEGRFFRFDAGTGTRSLVIEAGPQGLWANDGVVVFSLGGGKIYRLQ